MIEKFLYKSQQIRRKASKKMHVLNVVELDSRALRKNYEYYKKKHPESEICPVLKSNAYGHGLKEIARLCDRFSAPYIVVDSYYEALELKKIGIKTPLLVIGYTHPDNYRYMKLGDISITVLDMQTIEALGALKKKISIHLKIDTGMHRQGVPFDNCQKALHLIKRYKNLQLKGICTHLADADNQESDVFTKKQVEIFKKVLKITEQEGFDIKWKHISATGGAGMIFDDAFNMVRLGLGLYGDSPVDDYDRLHPVLRFESTVIDIKKLKKGDCVSYGCTFTAPKDMTIGVVPAGYYEGVDRRLSNKGYIYYKNKPCPIVGTVCMNLTMIDVSSVPDIKKWDKVTIISRKQAQKNSVRAIAEYCKTITYTVWTHIAPTIRRVIIE